MMGTDNYGRSSESVAGTPSVGKYRAKLRLVFVDRVEDNEAETEEFEFGENEEIVDVAWFSGSASVTLADVRWTRNPLKLEKEGDER